MTHFLIRPALKLKTKTNVKKISHPFFLRKLTQKEADQKIMHQKASHV